MTVWFELQDKETYFWDQHPVQLPDDATVDDMWQAGYKLCAEFDRRCPDRAPFTFEFAGRTGGRKED